jgi:hypothetical protein
MSSSRSRDQEEGEERARRKVTSHAVKVIWGLVAGGGGPRPTLRLEENARSSTVAYCSSNIVAHYVFFPPLRPTCHCTVALPLVGGGLVK